MKLITLTAVVFVSLIIAIVQSDDNSNLISLVLLYRHGARTPNTFYTNDPYYYNSTIFPEGFSQITNEGKNQLYALGLWLRSHYQDWLPTTYNASDIYVQSTSYDPTIMSAQCNLAGLYKPQGSQIWNASVPNWQPVPIHTIPEEYDSIFKIGVACDKWSALRDQVETEPFFSSIYTQLGDVFKLLSNRTGDEMSTLRDIKDVFDTLYVEDVQYNLDLPSWASEVYPGTLPKVVAYCLIEDTFNTTMARLKSGRLFHKIFRYFRDQADNSKIATQPKFLMFSADEAILSSLLNSMNAFDLERPPYASALIFELRRNVTDDAGTYLNILYRKNDEISNISANGCDLNCNLDDFRDHLQKVIVNQTNWEQECADTNNNGKFDDYKYDEASDL